MTTSASFTALPPLASALSSSLDQDRYESTTLPVRRFTVDEYHRMIDDGYFSRDERFELLEGWIVAKVSRTPPHDTYIGVGRRTIAARLSAGWHVRVQCAVTLIDSEPEPDLAVMSGIEEDYISHHPGPQEITLIVEVSSSTLSLDRDVMSRIYARSGVRAYWLFNLVDRVIEVYTQPSGQAAHPRYLKRADYRLGEQVPLEIDQTNMIAIPVADLLPSLR